jgi:hypothetical protein
MRIRRRRNKGCGCGTLFLVLVIAGFIGGLIPKTSVDSNTGITVTDTSPHKEIALLTSRATPEPTFTSAPELTSTLSKGRLPNATLTPGDIFYVTVEQLSRPGYTSTVRNVSNAIKHQVYAEYGITHAGGYVIDHLIPLEIGGSNEIANLWPQPKDEARIKDELEKTLHHLVISHKVALATAQQEIATNWVAAYAKFCGSKKEPKEPSEAISDLDSVAPRSTSTPEGTPQSAPQAKTHGPLVWVNTNTGVYHYPGTRWYGHTVSGRYVSEEEAIAEGDRPAKNGQ